MFRHHSLTRATGANGSRCFLPCCDYRKLNLVAFAGSLLYIGYIVGCLQSSPRLGAFPFDAGAEQTAYSTPSALLRATASSSDDAGGGAASDAAKDGKDDEKSLLPSAEDVAVGQGLVNYKRDKPVTSIVRRSINLRSNSEDLMANSFPFVFRLALCLHQLRMNGTLNRTQNLIGERHSGTNWIHDHLTSCFGDQIAVESEFTRFKHWFQFDDATVRNGEAVVIAMFRDPYDWVEAMRERPHHAHDHADCTDLECPECECRSMGWKDFVSKPWVGPRGPADKDLMVRAKAEGRKLEVEDCLAGYKFDEVIPCLPEDSVDKEGYSTYMYELMHDGSNRAYGSVIDLRREKLLNFLTVPRMNGVRAFLPQRYEMLVREGTGEFLKTLEEVTGLTAKCAPFEGTGVVQHKNVEPEFMEWMNEFHDWEAEGMIGYQQREHVKTQESEQSALSENGV